MTTTPCSWVQRCERLLLTLLLAAAATPATAHKASDAYLRLEVKGEFIEQRTDIALRDLDRELVLDADDNGELTWGEVRSHWPQIDQLAQAAIALQADGQACQPGPAGAAQLDSHSDGRYVVLTRRWTCAAPVKEVSVGYTLFATSDPTHRGILSLTRGADVRTAVLVPGSAPQRFGGEDSGHGGNAAGAGNGSDAVGDGAPSGSPGSFFGFVAEGVHHILIGTDHVLFLLALLLPAVLVAGVMRPRPGPGKGGSGTPAERQAAYAAARSRLQGQPALAGRVNAGAGGAGFGASGVAATAAQGAANAAADVATQVATAGSRGLAWLSGRGDSAWRAAPAFGPVAMNVAKVVTAFTLAHSITLALAVLGILNPPSRVVESVIAATVALAAIDNLYPFLPRERWKLTFVFGLAHGFGFASALQDLGLVRSALASSLLGFNLGVEIGQLGIVALFLPLAWWGRGTAFYRRVVLGGGSVVIALLALVWLAERALDLKLLG